MLAIHPGPDTAKQAQTRILLPLCFTDGMRVLCCNVVFAHCQTKRFSFKPKSLILVSSIHRTFFQSPSGSSAWSWANRRWQRCSFWKVAFSLQLCHTPLTFNVLLMVDSWTLTLPTSIKAVSFLDVSLESLVTSQTITHIALCVIFVVNPLLGRVLLVLDVFHFYTICLIVDCWSPNSFEIVL